MRKSGIRVEARRGDDGLPDARMGPVATGGFPARLA